MESKLYRAKPLHRDSEGLNRCCSLECAETGQLRSITGSHIPFLLHRVCMSLCVSEWMRNIYVSFLCLQVCLPVCERFHFDTAAVVSDGDPAWSSVHFECCKRSDWESTVCSSRSLTTVLTRPSFTTSQTPLEKQIQKNCIFGSLSALVDPGFIAFPSLSSSPWQLARWRSRLSSLDKYLVPLVAGEFLIHYFVPLHNILQDKFQSKRAGCFCMAHYHDVVLVTQFQQEWNGWTDFNTQLLKTCQKTVLFCFENTSFLPHIVLLICMLIINMNFCLKSVLLTKSVFLSVAYLYCMHFNYFHLVVNKLSDEQS